MRNQTRKKSNKKTEQLKDTMIDEALDALKEAQDVDTILDALWVIVWLQNKGHPEHIPQRPPIDHYVQFATDEAERLKKQPFENNPIHALYDENTQAREDISGGYARLGACFRALDIHLVKMPATRLFDGQMHQVIPISEKPLKKIVGVTFWGDSLAFIEKENQPYHDEVLIPYNHMGALVFPESFESISEYAEMLKEFDCEPMTKDEYINHRIQKTGEAFVAINRFFYDRCQQIDDKLKHPLAPIIKAWQLKGNGIKPDKQKRQIAPDFLKQSRLIGNNEELPVGMIQPPSEPTQGWLPGFERQSVIVPALPLQVYEAAGGKPTPGGKGAPLDQRLFVSTLCAYPLGEQEPDGARRLETTLRDITSWAYPTRHFQRQYDLPRIHKALYNLHNLRVSYERREWNVVQVFALPEHDTKLDDPLPLYVRMPDGVKGNGARIDVEIMRQYGVDSAPKFRAWIRLAYLWDEAKIKNGGKRIFATRPKVLRNDDGYITEAKGEVIQTGKLYPTDRGWQYKEGNIPQKAWYHPLAVQIDTERNPQADKMPVLDSTDLVHLFFDDKPQTPGTFRYRTHAAVEYAHEMHEEGNIVLEENAICNKTGKRGYRILEPRQKAIDIAN